MEYTSEVMETSYTLLREGIEYNLYTQREIIEYNCTSQLEILEHKHYTPVVKTLST
jgi:hypothetical protein